MLRLRGWSVVWLWLLLCACALLRPSSPSGCVASSSTACSASRLHQPPVSLLQPVYGAALLLPPVFACVLAGVCCTQQPCLRSCWDAQRAHAGCLPCSCAQTVPSGACGPLSTLIDDDRGCCWCVPAASIILHHCRVVPSAPLQGAAKRRSFPSPQ